MASKVNTKFVVGLSAVLLVAVAGMAFTAYTLVNNSASDLIKAGDERLAEGKVKDAVGMYSKAVNKEKTNVSFVRKWIGAMEKLTPENQITYEKQFTEYMAALRQLATLEPENPESAEKYLGMQFKALRTGRFDEGNWSAMATEADNALRAFAGKPSGPWESLRRYRGMINARRYSASTSPDPKMRDAALEDLAAALRANPNDFEAALVIADTKANDAQRLLASNREKALADMAGVQGTLDSFLAGSPDHPAALVAKTQYDLAITRIGMSPSATQQEIEATSMRFVERGTPLLDRAFARAKQMPMPLDDAILRQLQVGESLLSPGGRLARTEELVREGLKAKPDSATHLMLLAEFAKQRNDYGTAVEQLAKVTQLPDLPISFDGQLLFQQRRAALVQQALWSVRAWQVMPEGPEKAAAMNQARALRDRAANTVGNDDARMLLVDAQFAYVANTPEEVQKAARLLEEYNRRTDRTDSEALLLTAQIAVQRNQPGVARDTLGRLLQVQPNSIVAMLAMAELERSFQHREEAKRLYENVLRFAPGNEVAKRALEALRILDDPSKATDPLIQALAEVNKLQESLRDTPGANARMLAALKPLGDRFNFDPRVALPLAQAYVVNQDRDSAIRTLEASAKNFPDSKVIADQLRLLKIEDPAERRRAALAGASMPEVEKQLSLSMMLKSEGKLDEAQAALDEAIRLAPDDRRVIEAQFIELLDKKDAERARPIAERAVRENLDGFNGDTYRARLLAIEGNHAQAASLLKGIVDRGGAQPEVHRLLARMLTLDNRPGEAVEAYRAALQMRPTDVVIANDLITGLVQAGRTADALLEARDFRRFGESDLRFLKLWLSLEAQSGDRDLAIRQREQIAVASPADRENVLALAGLYIDTSQIEKASELITKTRAANDGLDIAAMDAMLQWGTGKQAEARKTFEDAIAKFNNPPTPMLEMGYAQFLRERGDIQGALEALNRARPLQDPKLMQVDRAVSDMGMQVGAADLAEAGARQVVAANADTPERLYQKRIVEMLLAQGKFDDAATEVAKLPQGAQADAQTLLLSAAIASGKNDARRSVELLNEAVTRFPRDPMVFMRRGEVLMRDKGTLGDAIEDFSRVIELQPDRAMGYRLRAQAYEMQGDTRKTEADIRNAISVEPLNDQVIFGYMGELARNAREDEADALAREVLRDRSRDTRYIMNVASFFRNSGRNDLAARWAREGFAVDQSDAVAMIYLSNLLDVSRPDIAEAQRVLGVVGTSRTRNNPIYMMSSAKISYAQNRVPEALKTAQDVVRLLDPQNQQMMESWYLDTSRMITDKAQLRTVLSNFANQGVAPEWMAYFRATSLVQEPATLREGVGVLDQLAGSARIPQVRRLVHNLRGNLAYQASEWAKAEEAWNLGVQEFPSDLLMTNNLAYLLTKQLGKHAEALPLAEKAAQGLRDQADVLDTLGVVYLNLGRNEDAARVLEMAGQASRTPQTALTVGVHYIEALRKINRVEDAKTAFGRLDALFARSKDQLPEEVRAGWEAHRAALK